MSVLFVGANNGDIADATTYQANWNLLEGSLFDIGPYVISGLVPTIGTGLSVNISSGVASVGGEIVKASFVIGSLAPSTTNHLYLLQSGIGTSNTTGTAPANSVKLGTAVTSGGAVTSVATGRSSGRQQFVRSDSLIPGGSAAGIASAGQPASINLAGWMAAAAEGVPVFGTLPAGAVTGITRAVTTKTSTYAATYADNVILANANGGGFTITLPTAVGHSGSDITVKKVDTTANAVTITTTSAQTIDGVAPPRTITAPQQALTFLSDGSNWVLV